MGACRVGAREILRSVLTILLTIKIADSFVIAGRQSSEQRFRFWLSHMYSSHFYPGVWTYIHLRKSFRISLMETFFHRLLARSSLGGCIYREYCASRHNIQCQGPPSVSSYSTYSCRSNSSRATAFSLSAISSECAELRGDIFGWEAAANFGGWNPGEESPAMICIYMPRGVGMIAECRWSDPLWVH